MSGVGSPITYLYSINGSYTVILTVTDSNATKMAVSRPLPVGPPLPINATIVLPSVVAMTCQASFSAIPTGGVAPYCYRALGLRTIQLSSRSKTA